jgi:hypothetical protein
MSKGSADYVLFPIQRYMDSEGNPTCALNYDEGWFCRFLDFGTLPEPAYCRGCEDPYRLVRGGIDNCFQIKPECPLWSDKVTKISYEDISKISPHNIVL